MYKSAKILVLSGCIAIAGLLHLCPRVSITPDHSRYYGQLCPHVKQPHVHPRGQCCAPVLRTASCCASLAQGNTLFTRVLQL
jgi:hypothetical protein